MDWGLFAYGARGWGDELLRGLLLTLELALISYCFGLVLGTICGLIELRRGPVLPRLLGGYAAMIRSVPELLVIFAAYFGLADGIHLVTSALGAPLRPSISPLAAGIIAISIVMAAYTSEVVKGAVRAVPIGMEESARALGLTRWLALRRIVLPIALRYAFPGLANLWMVVIKITPLVSAIQLEDFIRAAGTAGQNTKHYFVFYGAVLVVYLALSGLSMLAQSRMERRLFRHVAPLPA